MMLPSPPRLLPLLMLAWAGLVSGGAGVKEEIAITAAQAALVGVETAVIEPRPSSTGLRFPGRVTVPPDRTRLMNAPLGGRVERMTVTVDSPVRSGDVLAELQSPALAHAQAEFLVAYNKETLLRGTLDREQTLAPFGAVSKKQVITTQSEYDQARATAAERRQALSHYGMPDEAIQQLIATQSLDPRLVVISPIDGVVLEAAAVPGQTLDALAPIYRLAQLTQLWLEIQVPAASAAKFATGATVLLKDHSLRGRVVSVGNSVDATAQTVIVRAEFSDSSLALRPGQVVEAQIAPSAVSGQEWRVKAGALVRRGSDAFVFVQTTSGFTATPVRVREETPEFYVVSAAFRGDERIAVSGLAALKGAWEGLGGID
jgi:RND family efflux transporter MFP subunit